MGLCLRAMSFTNIYIPLPPTHFPGCNIVSWFSEQLIPVFVFPLVETRRLEGGWCGRNFLPPAEIKLWQNPFSWRMGFCYREGSRCTLQCRLIPFPCQSYRGYSLYLPRNKAHANVDHPGRLQPSRSSNSNSTFSSSPKLPCKCSYQFMAPATSAPGEKISAVPLDAFPSLPRY